MAAVVASNCQTFIDKVCQSASCTLEGATPPGGGICCEGLTPCPEQGNRCSVTCSGGAGGNTSFCPGGSWNVYECAGRCNLGSGCSDNLIGVVNNCNNPGSDPVQGVNCGTLNAVLNGSGVGGIPAAASTCFVRQADCIGTSGANLVFRSSYKCSNQCSTPGGSTDEPPTTTPSTPFCGDAICATNELCERTSPGGSSFRACTAANVGSVPTGQVVANCYRITDGTNQVAGTGPRCKFCGDGLFHAAEEQCDGTAPAGNGNDPANCSTACNIRRRECISATASTSTLAPGAGNRIIFTLRFRDERANYPYIPGVQARISTDGTTANAVGRDSNSTGSTLVGIIPGDAGRTRTQDTDGTYIYEYKFEWEAANTNGSDVAAGSYRAQFLNPSSGEPIFPTGCEANITVSTTQVENPLFSIVKLSTPVCESDNDSRIDYTIRATNRGPVEGIIDFVRDTLDPDVIAAGIVPTGITPTFGTYASGVITWIGSVADRTYQPNQTKEFRYTITIPSSMTATFSGTGIDNQVVVQYDTNDTDDNTDSFTLNTPLSCTITVIPVTGLFDDGRFMILGAMFVLMGVYVYRRQYSLEHSFEFEAEKKLSKKADDQ